MNIPNTATAWEALIARGAERKENRTAFLAALILERVNFARPADSPEMSPFLASSFAVELVRLAESIHGLAVADCNRGLNQSQESRMENLKARFHKIAEALGFEARTGGDPRGACAYLIDPDNRKGDGWGEGWAVYR